jgi:uncharacterized protein
VPGRIYEGFVPGRYQIDAYGRGGFRFAEMSHRGSILALPSGIHAWDVSDVAGLTPELFARVREEAHAIDLLLIGTGPEIAALSEPVRSFLRDAGVRIDVMPTGAAARTFNVLLAENRRVAAALIAVPEAG